jgi:hypothetical protein
MQGVSTVSDISIYGTSSELSSNTAPYEQVNFTVTFSQPHRCDAYVFASNRQGNTIWLAIFLTEQTTAQGITRWSDGGIIAVNKSGGRNVNEMTCDNVYINDQGKTMGFAFSLGSFDGGEVITVITNLGKLGESHTFSWGPL